MTRPARVTIDLAALRHNFSRVQKLAPGCKIMAVVKADAYGHGLTRVAQAISSLADAFAVACLEEAETLRTAGITRPIVLLEGPYSEAELVRIQTLELEAVIHHGDQVDMLERANPGQGIRLWIKIDTGMHRLGFQPEELPPVWKRLQACDTAAKPLRLMTHFATANEPGNAMTKHQLRLFEEVAQPYDCETSMANSAAVLAWPDSHGAWIRPGLMLYGISPLDNTNGDAHDLRPVMTFSSELISVKRLKKGEPVGYGAGWCCPEDMPVGIIAGGYGDGYPRHAESGTPVLVNGTRATVIGNASMDMLTVDLRSQVNARVGDPVELWGGGLSIEEVAEHAGTIPYELLCGVHKRLTFVERK